MTLMAVSGVLAGGGLVACKALANAMVLCFTVLLWLAVVLTAIWPFAAAFIMLCGTEEMRPVMLLSVICWSFNAAGLFLIAHSSRASDS